jgi:hypothetical protein
MRAARGGVALAVAPGAEDHEVVEPIVVGVAVEVMDLQRRRVCAPRRLAAMAVASQHPRA